MKNITNEQINAILNTIYQTNISVSQFDALKQLFAKLPECAQKTEEVKA